MPKRVNSHWEQQELLPFLDTVFGPGSTSNHPPKTQSEWEAAVRVAAARINTIRNYDDSIITVDRVRLALANSPDLSAAERPQTDIVTSDPDLCLTIFVRHSITHGPYPMMSLGTAANPDAIRECEMLHQMGERLPDICTRLASCSGYGGAYVGRGGKESFGALSHSGYVGFSRTSPHILSASASNFVPQGCVSSFLPGGHGGDTQKNDLYDIVNSMSDMGLQGQGHGAKQSILHVEAPEFVPGNREHRTFSLLAEEF